MAVKLHRVGFCLTAAVLLLALFLFSASYLLALLGVLLGLALALALLLRRDARRFSLQLHAAPTGQVEHPLELVLTTAQTHRLLAAGSAEVELEMEAVMFHDIQRRTLRIPLGDRQTRFSFSLPQNLCGAVRFRCKALQLWDLLGLFHASCARFPEVQTILFPETPPLDLTISNVAIGSANTEGFMQNRPGGDPSEVFDIREYVPGDDVRSIHWKLSCKTDTLICRQPSDPSHYDVALLPDLCLAHRSGPVTHQELNAAVALVIALGEQLLAEGIPFCLVLPAPQELQILEVQSAVQLHQQLLPQWMSMAVPSQDGAGLQYFLAEHMEQHFTRLFIVSAGQYEQDVRSLGKRIGITVLSTDLDAAAPSHLKLGPACESIILPAQTPEGFTYRILC